MIRLLLRSPRGTWLLAGAVWLAGCGALWSVLPYRPRAAWATEEPAVVHGFIPGTAVVLTSTPWSPKIFDAQGPVIGPLLARDAATGEVREWFPDNERLTLVDPGVDGRHVLVGRVLGGRARLFLLDAADGKVVAELPRGGPRAENPGDLPPDVDEQFAAFRPDGRRVVYADRVGDERWLRVWDVETRQETAGLRDAAPPAAWSPDGRSLAYIPQGQKEAAVGVWELGTGLTRALGPSPSPDLRPEQLHFSSNGQTVVSVLRRIEEVLFRDPRDTHEVMAWDVGSGMKTLQRQAHRAAFPAQTPWFAIENWDRPEGTCVHRYDYAGGALRDRFVLSEIMGPEWVGLSPDGGLVLRHDTIDNPIFEFLDLRLLQGALGTNVRPVVWETGSGRLRHVLPMAIDPDVDSPAGHAWSADGTFLAIAGEDELTVWDIPPRRSLKWFMAGAALFALPPFVIARRRVRRLRREAAA
ncbi:MAG TPA: hypothetical protein VL371_01470 [Gemmataceae bacterium]|nr:hypothetical protein [Gemmataceae bacterium]